MTNLYKVEELAVLGCVRNPQAHSKEECIKCEFKNNMCNQYSHAKKIIEYIDDSYKSAVERQAFNYKNAMILSIAEMFKYGEIDEEQRDLLYHHNYCVYQSFINPDSPPVIGQWKSIKAVDGTNHSYKCSVCDHHSLIETRYCPDCGIKMESENLLND